MKEVVVDVMNRLKFITKRRHSKEEKKPHGLVYLRDPSPTDSTELIENASSSVMVCIHLSFQNCRNDGLYPTIVLHI